MTVEDKKADCLFCKIASGEIKADFIYSDDNFFVILDKFPASDGHCLIITKKHYENILDLPSSLGTELLSLAKKQGLRLIQEKKGEGFNLVNNNFKAAGQEIPHFHLHVVPRKQDDGMKFVSKYKDSLY